jgi:hypothetical protein
MPVAVVFARAKGVKAGKPSYDIPEFEKNPGNNKRVPLYGRNFTIAHKVTIDKNAKPGSQIVVTGVITYQTCDERVVYPKRTMPLRWTIQLNES